MGEVGGHSEKWRLALDMRDELAESEHDAASGRGRRRLRHHAHLRAGLAERGIDYVLPVRADVSAHPFDAQPVAPERKGPIGCCLQRRYRHYAPSVAVLAAGLGQGAFVSLTWRQGSRGQLRSRFAAVRVRPAGKAVERPIRAAASAEQDWWDGVLPDYWPVATMRAGVAPRGARERFLRGITCVRAVHRAA
ncbi:transposase, partial [Streptomyces galbus]|uniref:transposase n=1 Tax=Streptomyces galbus TaxID=33898 RepID=UPI00382E268A